jgi:RNA polymerase sigma-70 factor, ECF subfamily
MEWILGHREAATAAGEAGVVERCRRGDAVAFGRFVDLYQARVFGYVRRMLPSLEEAEDVTQEVFVRAFQHFPRYDGRACVRTWLFRIAHNLCIDRARRSGRRVTEASFEDPQEGTEYEFADARFQPDLLAMSGELAATVDAAVAALSPKLRSVLLLHEREEMGYDEIAAALDIPVGTVKSRLYLARRTLQRELAPYFDTEAPS